MSLAPAAGQGQGFSRQVRKHILPCSQTLRNMLCFLLVVQAWDTDWRLGRVFASQLQRSEAAVTRWRGGWWIRTVECAVEAQQVWRFQSSSEARTTPLTHPGSSCAISPPPQRCYAGNAEGSGSKALVPRPRIMSQSRQWSHGALLWLLIAP